MEPEAYFRVAYRSLGGRDLVWRELHAYLDHVVEGGIRGTVVDLGAGYCSFINAATGARRRIAVDVNPESAAEAAAGVEFHAGPAEDLDFLADGAADVVFASNLLEHLPPETGRRVVAAAHRVLRPGGSLILVQPNFTFAFREYFHDVTHRTIYTHVGLRDLLEAEGFDVVRVEPRFLPLSMQSKYGGVNLPAVPEWLIRPALRLYLSSPLRAGGKQMLIVGRKPTASRSNRAALDRPQPVGESA